MLARSPCALPAYPPRAHRASRTAYLCVPLVTHFASNFVGAAQYVCEINQGIAEAVTGVLGGAQFSSGPFYHPRSSRGCFGHPREAAVCAGNFPDSNGISDDFKRQKRSHHTEPVPQGLKMSKIRWFLSGRGHTSPLPELGRPQTKLIHALKNRPAGLQETNMATRGSMTSCSV
jgi:hypothetical protein